MQFRHVVSTQSRTTTPLVWSLGSWGCSPKTGGITGVEISLDMSPPVGVCSKSPAAESL